MDIEAIRQLELDWLEKYRVLRSASEDSYGWEPFPISRFYNMLILAMSHNRGPFLDVGCGIGTKVLLASQVGIEAQGIELFPEYVAEAERLGVKVEQADARSYGRYGEFGIIYINHPLRDIEEEDKLERHIQRQMVPGSVLIAVNNIRTVPRWNKMTHPVSPDPNEIRFDWLAVKPEEELWPRLRHKVLPALRS